MSPHYQRFLRMIQRGHYFHVGNNPLWKSYGYIDNTTFQYLRLLEAPADLTIPLFTQNLLAFMIAGAMLVVCTGNLALLGLMSVQQKRLV